MRLLNAELDPPRVVDFPGKRPPYAILSHTWGDGEVTLQDLQQPDQSYKSKPGFSKLLGCCKQATKDGFGFVWIDTCCIDKTNSVELSEAINSMYGWYREARVCYAYLADMPRRWSVFDVTGAASELDRLAHIKNSRWFARGWTLQELIAPDVVEFYDADWSEIGTKSSLRAQIASITGIDSAVLEGERSPHTYSVAERMAWASARSTTRVEDRAYSLFGIFDVNMPLIYGEGNKAFFRLQEEIMRCTEDYSILAWDLRSTTSHYRLGIPDRHETNASRIEARECNPLAENPDQFQPEPGRSPGDFTYHGLEDRTSPDQHDPPKMTARGLSISLPLLRCGSVLGDLWLAYIGCQLRGRAICMRLYPVNPTSTIVFHRVSLGWRDNGYYFLEPGLVEIFSMARICLRQHANKNLELGKRNFWFDRSEIPISVRDLRHCNQWRAKQCCQWGGCGLRCRLILVDKYAYYVCFTDDGELFAMVLGAEGAGIHPLGLVHDRDRSLTAQQILHGKLDSKTRILMTLQEQATLASMQENLQERATHYFFNCAVTIALKRQNGRSTFYISSRWTHLRHVMYSRVPPPRPKLDDAAEDSDVS